MFILHIYIFLLGYRTTTSDPNGPVGSQVPHIPVITVERASKLIYNDKFMQSLFCSFYSENLTKHEKV